MFNRLGGWYSYRMSEAMLNMLIKNMAVEWQRRDQQIVIAGYHPGTVDANIAADKLFSAEYGARYLLHVMSR